MRQACLGTSLPVFSNVRTPARTECNDERQILRAEPARSGLPGLSHRPSSGDKAASAPQEDDGSGAQDAGFQRQEDPDTKLKSHGAGGRLSRTLTVYSSNGLHDASQPKGGNGPRVPRQMNRHTNVVQTHKGTLSTHKKERDSGTRYHGTMKTLYQVK